MGFRRDPLYFYGAIIIGFVAWYWIVKALKEQRKEKSYGLLKFKYNNYYKIVKITQKRAIRDHNRYIRNFVRKHKRNPDRRESSSSYDLNGMEMLTRKIYNVINRKRSVNKFIIFWEEEILIER